MKTRSIKFGRVDLSLSAADCSLLAKALHDWPTENARQEWEIDHVEALADLFEALGVLADSFTHLKPGDILHLRQEIHSPLISA